MSKLAEFQKVYEEIESEVSYVYPSDTISSFRLLVDEMIGTLIELEAEKTRLEITLGMTRIALVNHSSLDKALAVLDNK